MHWVTLLAAFSLFEFNSCRLNSNVGFNKELEPLTHSFKFHEYQVLTQKLDHFDLTDKRTWRQSYVLCDEHYKPGKPVMLFLTNGELSNSNILAGGTGEMALKYESMVIILETRYYGLSQPTENITTENLIYMNADQILSDTAHFIDYIMEEKKLPPNTRWITLGCGRGGSWAAWMRMKFPHLVHGAVASSGTFLVKEEYNDLYDIIKETLDGKYPKCSNVIQTGMRQLHDMLEDPKNKDEILTTFNLCKPLSSKEDNDYLLTHIVEEIIERFKYNIQVRNDVLGSMCGILNNPSGEPEYKKLAEVVRGRDCFNANYNDKVNNLINAIDNKSNPELFNERIILYQKCSEYGLFKTSEPNSIFGHTQTLESKLKYCMDVFGPEFDQDQLKLGLEKTNRRFGGLNFKADNVLYTYFTQDPYLKTGLNRSSGKRSRIIKAEGGFHCADLHPNAYVQEDVMQVKPRILYYVGNMLRY